VRGRLRTSTQTELELDCPEGRLIGIAFPQIEKPARYADQKAQGGYGKQLQGRYNTYQGRDYGLAPFIIVNIKMYFDYL